VYDRRREWMARKQCPLRSMKTYLLLTPGLCVERTMGDWDALVHSQNT
jgi:hypothetical protein